MKTIYVNNSTFEKTYNSNTPWKTFANTAEGFNLISNIGAMVGGLDHVKKTKNQIQFHDIGCSIAGEIIDHSFQIRRKK